MKKSILNFITNVLVCGCIGIIVDFFAKTSFIFTVIGLVVGIVVAIILNNKNKKEG